MEELRTSLSNLPRCVAIPCRPCLAGLFSVLSIPQECLERPPRAAQEGMGQGPRWRRDFTCRLSWAVSIRWMAPLVPRQFMMNLSWQSRDP
eukprot:1362332-Pyramimonas_sp.AAC.1